MPHVGDLLVELLARYGVTDIFGQPGGQTAALYDGVARRSGRVSHTLVRDERSAAYAADAFARLTRRPGVCDVTVGPGTTKLTDGLVESLNASVPVIAPGGVPDRDQRPPGPGRPGDPARRAGCGVGAARRGNAGRRPLPPLPRLPPGARARQPGRRCCAAAFGPPADHRRGRRRARVGSR